MGSKALDAVLGSPHDLNGGGGVHHIRDRGVVVPHTQALETLARVSVFQEEGAGAATDAGTSASPAPCEGVAAVAVKLLEDAEGQERKGLMAIYDGETVAATTAMDYARCLRVAAAHLQEGG